MAGLRSRPPPSIAWFYPRTQRCRVCGVSVLCLESLLRRTLLLKFGRRLHLHKGGPYIPRQEFIRREGRPTRVHVLRDKRALEGPPRLSYREQRMPFHAFLVCFWDTWKGTGPHHHTKLGHSVG